MVNLVTEGTLTDKGFIAGCKTVTSGKTKREDHTFVHLHSDANSGMFFCNKCLIRVKVAK